MPTCMAAGSADEIDMVTSFSQPGKLKSMCSRYARI
jgi:hypothetical protein